jgi:hypothetical protein
MTKTNNSTSKNYETPQLITYGKVENLTQMAKKGSDDNGAGTGSGNKVFGADDGHKSKVL